MPRCDISKILKNTKTGGQKRQKKIYLSKICFWARKQIFQQLFQFAKLFQAMRRTLTKPKDAQKQEKCFEVKMQDRLSEFNRFPSHTSKCRNGFPFQNDKFTRFAAVNDGLMQLHRSSKAKFHASVGINSIVQKRADAAQSLDAYKKLMRKDRRECKGDSLPITSELFIEKCNLKDRYDVAEIHSNSCGHCRIQKLTFKLRNFVGLEPVRNSEVEPEFLSALPDVQTGSGTEVMPLSQKKKIVVHLPKTDYIYKESQDTNARFAFLYTHKKKHC